jgi:cell division protein ZapA (FtsZ GTPase activity inhibitor)
MENNELNTINITIAGRTFPVKVTEDEKAGVLALESELNEKIIHFQKTYSGRDKLDYVIMTLLTYVYDLKEKQQEPVSSEAVTKVQSMLDMLSDF